MRKRVIWGVVLACLTLLIARGGGTTERTRGIEAAAATRPTQVEVTNFPAVQPVNGTVNVGNFPAIQSVNGTVSVANLPVDASGRVLVVAQVIGSGALVLHSTAATYTGNLGGRTGATRKCQAEFPGSHFANVNEVSNAYQTRGIVWLTSDTDVSWVDDLVSYNNCSANTGMEWQFETAGDGSRIDGNLIRAKGTNLFNAGPCSDPHPIVCAE